MAFLYFCSLGIYSKNYALASDRVVYFRSTSCFDISPQLAACLGAGFGAACFGGPFASMASSLFLKSSGDGSGSGVVSGA